MAHSGKNIAKLSEKKGLVKTVLLHSISICLCMLIGIYSIWVYPYFNFLEGMYIRSITLSYCCMAFTVLILVALYQKKAFILNLRIAAYLCCAFMPIAACMVFYFKENWFTWLPLTIVLFIFAFSFVVSTLILAKNLLRISINCAIACFSLSFLICAAVFGFVYNLEPMAMIILTLVVFPLYLFVQYLIEKHDNNPLPAKRIASSSNTKVPTIFIYTFIIIGYLSANCDYYINHLASGSIIPYTLSGAFLLAAAIALLYGRSRALNFNQIFFVFIIPLFCLALLVAINDTSPRSIVATILSDTAKTLSELVFFILIIYLCKFSIFQTYELSLYGLLGFCLGLALGQISVEIISNLLSKPHLFTQSASIALFVALLSCILLFNKKNMRDGWGSITVKHNSFLEDEFSNACNILSERACLTDRESQILQLLARGKNNARICEMLCISTNTVKMHNRNIYSKFSVHSRQEIIDIVQTAIEDNR